MGKYTTTNIVDKDGIVSHIRPQEEIPVIYIDLLNGKSGTVTTLRLTEQDEALIEKYSKNISQDIRVNLTEIISGAIGIEDLNTPELLDLSELPYKAVKRKGFIREAAVRTFAEFKESNKIHTQIHYSVVDEHGGEVTPIIINGLLIVPERVATAYSFSEATGQHGLYRTRISRQLKSFEKEYEKIRRASS